MTFYLILSEEPHFMTTVSFIHVVQDFFSAQTRLLKMFIYLNANHSIKKNTFVCPFSCQVPVELKSY